MMAKSILLGWKKGDTFTFTPSGGKSRSIKVKSVKNMKRKGAFVKAVAQMQGTSPRGIEVLVSETEYMGKNRLTMLTKRQTKEISRYSKKKS